MPDIMYKNNMITENISITEVVMKKSFSVIFILLAFIITIGCFSGFSKSKVIAEPINEILSESKSAYLIDQNTQTIIYSKNENGRYPIASMCKVMTLLLCFDALNNNEIELSEPITISENAANMGGSQVFLEANGQYTVGELIKSIIVASANDACVAMAERLCGSEDIFVQKMNEKATELGMNDTVFVNCTGLPKPGQYSSAKDVAKMFSELIKNKEYFRFSRIWTDVVKHPKDRLTEISNTNKLIRFYQGCDGGKTGYTSEAGHCLVATATRNAMRLICVVISSPDSKTRFKEVSAMFNYGFANYTNKMIIDDKKTLDIKVEIVGGKKDTVSVIAENPVFIFTQKNQKRSFEIDFVPNSNIKAPVNKGDKVGVLYVFENGIEIANVNVIATETISELTYFDTIKNIGKNWSLI